MVMNPTVSMGLTFGLGSLSGEDFDVLLPFRSVPSKAP